MTIQQLKAWGVHAFTASGVVFGLLAMLALIERRPADCLMWLGITLFVDGVDGTLARRYEVKKFVPQFDGAILDLIIDYLNYVFIAAVFIYYFVDLPVYTHALSAIIILLSSFFCFCNVNMKSEDYYFVGFPAVWNIVAFCMVVINAPAIINFLVIVLLGILSVVPFKYLHPFRVRKAMPFNIGFSFLWLISSAFLIAQYGQFQTWTLVLWYISGLYIVGFSLWQTIHDKLSKAL